MGSMHGGRVALAGAGSLPRARNGQRHGSSSSASGAGRRSGAQAAPCTCSFCLRSSSFSRCAGFMRFRRSCRRSRMRSGRRQAEAVAGVRG